MSLTDAQITDVLDLLRKNSERPKCGKVKLALIVIVSVIIGLLVGAMPW